MIIVDGLSFFSFSFLYDCVQRILGID
jgi:hypothetical protein